MWAPLGKKKQLPGLNSWKKNSSWSCWKKTVHKIKIYQWFVGWISPTVGQEKQWHTLSQVCYNNITGHINLKKVCMRRAVKENKKYKSKKSANSKMYIPFLVFCDLFWQLLLEISSILSSGLEKETFVIYPASRGYIFAEWAVVQWVASADNSSIFYGACTKFVKWFTSTVNCQVCRQMAQVWRE